MPPPRRDAVHKFFDYDASVHASTCHVCGKRVKGRHTSNLKSHLAVKHVEQFTEVQEANKDKSFDLYKQKNAEDNPKNPIPRIKKLCMRLVAVGDFPLDIIKCEDFQNILSLAAASNGRSEKISEDAIKEIIVFSATYIKHKIAEEIRNKLIYLLVSTAIYKRHKFLGIFIKYTFQDKIVVRNLLTTKCMKSEMGDFLMEMLSEVFKDFQISKDQIYSVTTGSYKFENDKEFTWVEASANNANSDDEDASQEKENLAAKKEESQVAEESEEFSQQEFIENLFDTDNENIFTAKTTFCGVNILNLPIKDAIEENTIVQDILHLAQNICKILDSGANRKLLKSAKAKVPSDDFTTKWKSLYKILSRLRKLRDISESIDEISSTEIDESEFWKELDNLINCLKPFNESSFVLQNERLTIGDFFIQWMKCKSKVESMRYHFAKSLLMAMESREKDILNTDLMLEALYLDSRLNILLSEEQCERAKVIIKQTWKHIQSIEEDSRDQDPLDDSFNQSDIAVKVEFDCDSAQPGLSVRAQSSSSLRSDLMGLEKMLMRAEMAQGRVTKRVTSFEVLLQELRAAPRLPLDTDILSHWSSKPTNSELDKVATTVLAAPVTQISPKSMWAAISFLLNPVRYNLNSNLLNNMLLIRTNQDLLD